MNWKTRMLTILVNRTRQFRTGIFQVSVCCAAMLLVGTLTPSHNAQADIGATHDALVSEFASFNTPGALDGRVEAIAVDGDTVFVGGTFTQIQEPLNGEIIDQPYLFAYSKSSGNIIRSFDPQLNNEVYALETTGEGTGIFVGGVFTILNDETNNRGLLKLDDNGDRVSGFVPRPDAVVHTLVRLGNTLYVGGNFTRISRTDIEYLAAIDTVTGAVDSSLDLDFDGTISTDRANGVPGIREIDITSDGRLMGVVGNFLTIDGLSRPRLALLELDGQAKVSTWNTNVFDGDCPSGTFPIYILGLDISPDDSYMLTSSSGFRRRGEPNCDTAIRFEIDDLTNDDVQPTWVNYTGGDSVYDVVSTGHAVYVGGHFEFLNNDLGSGNRMGPGGTPRRGLAALDPKNGLTILDWRSDRSPRGLGTFALISEEDGLYIGDDTDFLNGTEHQKLKFLPIANDRIFRPEIQSLPTTLLTVDEGTLNGSSFDGVFVGAPVELQSTDLGDSIGALFVGDQLFHVDDEGNMLMSRFDNDVFDSAVSVDLFGLTETQWALSEIGGMYFDHDRGRVYYTFRGDSELHYRAFSPDGPYFGNDESIADEQSDILWGDVSGMDVIDGHLYFTRTDGNLYRAEVDGYEPISGTTEVISGSEIDGRTWNNSMLAFIDTDAIDRGSNSGAELEFENNGSTTVRTRRTFEFPVDAGETVNVRLSWLNTSAEIDLRVRDADGVQVASDTTSNGSPKWLIVPAGEGGIYTATIQFQAGSSAYNLQINPNEQPPEPLADFEFSSEGSPDDGKFQSFDFDVEAGELIEAQVFWDNPDADVRVFLRDENRTLIERDIDGGSPGFVSAVAETSGEWSIAVQVRSGSTTYDVLVDTTTDFVVPEPLADFEFSSSGSPDDGKFQSFDFDVEAGELIEAQVFWENPDAEVRVFLRDETRTLIVRDIEGGSPGTVSAVAESSGQWSIAVQVRSGSTNYDVLVDTTTDFVIPEPPEPPEPRADFEFSSSGSQDSGRFQSFNIDVVAGELVEAQVLWENSDANVRVFLRDENRTLIERDIDGGSPGTVSAVAESSGRWSVAVQVRSGSTNYDVLVDTTTDFVVPEPLADFEFSSSGSPDDGRFQSFNFDVDAGELVDAEVYWDDPAADVRVFLRDETRTLQVRDVDGGAPAMVSVVAESSGRWSIAVQVNSGSVNYDIFIDTTPQ